MLVRLNVVEVSSVAYAESVLSVESEKSRGDGVATVVVNMLVGVVRVIKVLVARGVRVVITTDEPDKFLNRVVKGELDGGVASAHRLFTLELNLLNEVLMRELGELLALIGVKVDIVDPERSGSKNGRRTGIRSTVAFDKGSKLDFNFYIVNSALNYQV